MGSLEVNQKYLGYQKFPDNKKAKKINLLPVSTDLRQNTQLVKPEPQHLKANFITFTAFGKPNKQQEPFKDLLFPVVNDTGKRLKDFGGNEEIKKIINEEVLSFIKDPQRYKEQGSKIPKGVLLNGPTGTGKTLLAKAIAGEAAVPFIAVSGSEFVEKYVGVGASRIRDMHRAAIHAARNHPSKTAIVFIDEFDALGKKRGGGNQDSEREQTLNQLLTTMDGFIVDENGDLLNDVNIVYLAATNLPEALDPAIIRPGRFDYNLDVPNPARNKTAREYILEIHSRNKNFESEESKKKILKDTAEITKGMSGAELEDLMNKASIRVANRDHDKYIKTEDVTESYLRILAGPELRNDSPRWMKKDVLAHECGHALLNQVMQDVENDPWNKPRENSMIVNQERGKFMGAVFTNDGENVTYSDESVIANLAGMYGGYAVEKMLNGSNFAGVQSDLEQATNLATTAVAKWGLGSNTKYLAPAANDIVKAASTDNMIKDIRTITKTAAKIAEMSAEFHKDFIKQYVNSYEKIIENGGNILTGAEYNKMLQKWYKESGKDKELPEFQDKIKNMIQKAKKSDDE